MHTSCISTTGGPSAISSAFVPGRIRLEAPLLRLSLLKNLSFSSYSETPGDVGPIWSSAMGGGEGSRGEEAGERAAMTVRGGVEGAMGGAPSTLAVRLINIGREVVESGFGTSRIDDR